MRGFSLRGKERLKELKKVIKKQFPETEIVEPEYFERYKRGLFFVKKSIPNYAAVVLDMIGEIDDDTIFVGYSSGGLIVRWMVEELGVSAKAVILVGTPNKGIKISWWEKIIQRIIRVPCVEDMKDNSEFLQRLNKGLNSLPRNYYYLGGRHDKRVPLESSLPEEILRDTKRYVGAEIFWTDHSGLIPKASKGKISVISAIPAIIRILKKEIET